MLAGCEPPAHAHAHHEEWLQVLEGSVRAWIGDDVHRLGGATCSSSPRRPAPLSGGPRGDAAGARLAAGWSEPSATSTVACGPRSPVVLAPNHLPSSSRCWRRHGVSLAGRDVMSRRAWRRAGVGRNARGGRAGRGLRSGIIEATMAVLAAALAVLAGAPAAGQEHTHRRLILCTARSASPGSHRCAAARALAASHRRRGTLQVELDRTRRRRAGTWAGYSLRLPARHPQGAPLRRARARRARPSTRASPSATWSARRRSSS